MATKGQKRANPQTTQKAVSQSVSQLKQILWPTLDYNGQARVESDRKHLP